MGFNFCSTDWRKQWPGSRKTSGSWGKARRSPDGPMLAFQFPVIGIASEPVTLTQSSHRPTMLFTITDYPAYELILNSTVETCRREQHEQWRALWEYSCSDQRPGTDWFPDFKCGPLCLGNVHFLWGSGGWWDLKKSSCRICWLPPLHQKIFRVPPFFPKIIEMIPPLPKKKQTNKTKQKTRTLKKKERFLFLFVNLDTVLYRIQLLKKKHQHLMN